MRFLILLLMVSCSTFDPSDEWAQFPAGDPEFEKELNQYDDEDLETMISDVDKKPRRKNVKSN